MQVATDLHVSISATGLLISGYALGVFVGAPLLTAATGRLPRKAVLVALMVVFILGNLFTGLTVSTLLGVPAGAWLGLQHGWRATFWGDADRCGGNGGYRRVGSAGSQCVCNHGLAR